MASAIALSFSLFLTPVFLRLFRRWGWGQVIRTPDAGNNPQHELKRGTPTMGGVIFVGGTTIAYLIGTYAGGNPPTISGFLVLWMMVGFALACCVSCSRVLCVRYRHRQCGVSVCAFGLFSVCRVVIRYVAQAQ